MWFPIFTLVATLTLTCALQAHAGAIAGIVRAEGKDTSPQDAGGGKYDSRKYKFAERINYAELRDFVVYIDGITAQKPPQPQVKTITQKGVTFIPGVMPVMVGTIIEWPNQDEIFHNVFSISEAKQFDLDLYRSPEIKRVPFDKPGRVDVFCSIHTTMSCVILVLENPWFALSDTRGHYSITNVPPGTYKLKAWHERLPTVTKDVVVTAEGEVKVDFTMGIVNLPKY